MANLYFNHFLPTGLSVVTEPTTEPITVAEAKLWARQEADFTADDDIFSSLIVAARKYAEAYQKRTLITTTYRFVLDHFPAGYANMWSPVGPAIELPLPVLQSVTSVSYI